MYVKNQFDQNIKIIRFDNGNKFIFTYLYDKLVFYIKGRVLKLVNKIFY